MLGGCSNKIALSREGPSGRKISRNARARQICEETAAAEELAATKGEASTLPGGLLAYPHATQIPRENGGNEIACGPQGVHPLEIRFTNNRTKHINAVARQATAS